MHTQDHFPVVFLPNVVILHLFSTNFSVRTDFFNEHFAMQIEECLMVTFDSSILHSFTHHLAYFQFL